MELEAKWEGRLDGTFRGYECRRVYVLSDGSRWRQELMTNEYAYRERPFARLLWGQSIGGWYLDIEGTSSTVWVVPDRRGLVRKASGHGSSVRRWSRPARLKTELRGAALEGPERDSTRDEVRDEPIGYRAT